ncbi:hypothetical protein [Methanobacterium spitsbergense]|uniref:Uncharacterized protein n=1 Tax=Methanobacterium spitsbergense TaxID=2874285 RepID=A0A8T5V3K1_9EURY|nr:hypothetical protein [Methanobacterium spitsbergense]MBZ2166441.1 hypothetical protein [Methanobacterium spitsbergense]
MIESRMDIKSRIRNLEIIYKKHQLLTNSDLVIVEKRLEELKGELKCSRYR